MKKCLLINFLLIFSLTIIAQSGNDKFENEWIKVKQFEDKDLPQSAADEVDIILKNAIKRKNNQQVIKALIYKNKYKKQIDSNDNEGLFADLQNLAQQSTNPAETALLNSMLAELYQQYYTVNTWSINARTDIIGFVPDDMKEWSRNIFVDKVVGYTNASIEPKDELKKYTTSQFEDIIQLGEDAQEYYPTLYDFLISRAIYIVQNIFPSRWHSEPFNIADIGISSDQILKPAGEYAVLAINTDHRKEYIIWSYYQQFFSDLLSRRLIPTVVLMEIDKLNFINQITSLNYESKLDALIEMEKIYADSPSSIELINEIVNAVNSNYSQDNAHNQLVYDWCKKGIGKYPDYKRIDLLKKRLAELERPSIGMNGKALYYPNQPININVVYKNTQAIKQPVTFELYRRGANDGSYNLVKKIEQPLVSETTYNNDTLTLNLGVLTNGRYVLTRIEDGVEPKIEVLNTNGKYEFVVSALTSFTRKSEENIYEIFVVDRMSGKPVADASVNIYPYILKDKKWQYSTEKRTIKTNSLGLAVYTDTISDKRSYRYNIAEYAITKGDDDAHNRIRLYNTGMYVSRDDNQDEQKPPVISVFTDRSIYRPGQTVYFKAIAIDANTNRLLTNKKLTVTLSDQSDDIAEKDLETNDFGSIAGEFILPQNGLNGGYYINIDDEYAYFQVEEYKRPTFDVTFDENTKTYKLGDRVTIKGFAKNFSGVSLQGADVNYTVIRQPFRLWWLGQSTNIDNGTVKTNGDGSFEISFVAESEKSENNTGVFRNVYNFTIEASVTDVNGETQTANFSMPVGDVSLILNLSVADKIDKLADSKILISAVNLNDQDVKTSGMYILYTLGANDSIQSKVLDGKFTSGEDTGISPKLKTLASGKYRLQVKANDDQGREVSDEKDFILYSFTDKKPPVKGNDWLIVKNDTIAKGRNAEFVFGVTDKDVNVLYRVYSAKKIFEQKFIKFDNENKRFVIPYNDEYVDGTQVVLTFVKQDKFYNKIIPIVKAEEKTDNTLIVKLTTFRDRLRPGQEETWTLSVSDGHGDPSRAEVLASMYDTSLDKLYAPVFWQFNRPYKYRQGIIDNVQYNYADFAVTNISTRYSFLQPINVKYQIQPLDFDKLNWFGYLNSVSIKSSIANKEVFALSDAFDRNNAVFEEVAVVGYGLAAAESKQLTSVIRSETVDGLADGGTVSSAPQIRRNFNETAFFYPQLRTNDKGETLISFTVPESNTIWLFSALAHDKDLKSGQLEKDVVTRKELMVTPNMPRFVRQGDRTSISTKISNLSENVISGVVSIEFFDPATDQIIDLGVAGQSQSFDLSKDASSQATWTFDVPKDIELIGCRIVAQNEAFSDGEQHVLAVLSNRMLVTESMPFDVIKGDDNVFVFDKLYNNKSKTLENYRLTLEFAGNPAWYAVQALPVLSNPANENAVNWFAAYYVNSLGASIVKQYPKVSAMIENWKKVYGGKETLVSKLQKNEELKNVLLEETPWVLDAKNETEQMQRLSLLFDLNNTKQQTSASLAKLKDLQTGEGGWSWYKGMYPSRSITQYILYGFAQLQLVGQIEYGEDVKMMQIDALKYVDSKIAEDYKNLQKQNKEWNKIESISTLQLEYLYIRSFYRDIPVDVETREAERFYTGIANKYWKKLDLYQRSLLVVLLQRNGDKPSANAIAKSIREYAIVDKTKGMYWPNNRSRVFMAQSAVSTHTFLMDALKETGASSREMDEMKRWLLSQKRTQQWESTHATIDAVNTLLSTGSDWFANDAKTPLIKIGNTAIDISKDSELGTAYFKRTWSKPEITNSLGKIEVTEVSDHPAYGALYWQYFEDLNSISHSGSGSAELSINKLLFKEILSGDKKTLIPITGSDPLTIGDKVIVRLTLRAADDLDFVQLKDMRAACFEPVEVLSGTRYQNNLFYYQTTKDASTNFYFDFLPKGTYVLEYPVYVNRTGSYSNGITTIQCAYAPEYTTHTQGFEVEVKDK